MKKGLPEEEDTRSRGSLARWLVSSVDVDVDVLYPKPNDVVEHDECGVGMEDTFFFLLLLRAVYAVVS